MATKEKKLFMEDKEGIDALFLYATEGILTVNDRGMITRCNPSAERLFGYSTNELNGKTIEVLIPKRFSEKHVSHRDSYTKSPHPRSMGSGTELYGLKKDGTEFPLEISLSPYTSPAGRFVIAFIVDITLRKQAEEKLKSYSAELEKKVKDRTLILEEAILELERTKNSLHAALQKEKDLNELKSRFVSMASHEFRTPLTTIMSSLSLVTRYGEQNDKIKQSEHVSKIKASITNLTDILNDFLSLSKLEEGRISSETVEFDLRKFLEDLVAEMKPIAKEGQELLFEYKGEELVLLDNKLLKNILVNLISNAIKFSGPGKTIRLKAEAGDPSITISVKDEGIGIPAADQKHLFERFFRGKNATNIQGTGLGLSIVMRYLDLMNGDISFRSTENKGTEFILNFPNEKNPAY